MGMCARLSSPLLDRSTPPSPTPSPPSRLHTVYFALFSGVSAGLTQARDSQSESNYADNYQRDLVRPGFVFKWSHLPLSVGAASSKDSLVSPLQYSEACFFSPDRTHTRLHREPGAEFWLTCELICQLNASRFPPFSLVSLNGFA